MGNIHSELGIKLQIICTVYFIPIMNRLATSFIVQIAKNASVQ